MSSPERRPTSGSREGGRGSWKKPGNKGRRSMASRSSPISFKKNEEECLALMRGLRCGVSEDLSAERSFCRIFVGGSQKAGLLEEVDEEKEGQNDIYYKTGESKAAGNSLFPKKLKKEGLRVYSFLDGENLVPCLKIYGVTRALSLPYWNIMVESLLDMLLLFPLSASEILLLMLRLLFEWACYHCSDCTKTKRLCRKVLLLKLIVAPFDLATDWMKPQFHYLVAFAQFVAEPVD
ncbi:hypothetical protein MLD38_006661 [Melastoma candidum]|uniref:Uncharacterized protein n=1 Tax=Melastoma candidum TaxID=119954 RepID=A0ACB9RN60_9MYRT|nr:hypothetical protein MLD38_006661 [Melastoma candidum]